jgi:RND family efflux transporter MFP subunit
MRRARTIPVCALAIALGAAPACKGRHSHDQRGEHAHPGQPHEQRAELPGQSVTLWTPRTELFMEHQPLIVGQEVSFAAHVTVLTTWKPLTDGAITLTATLADGHTFTGKAERPSSPGIFRPVLKPDRAGKCQLAMRIDGTHQDSFPVGPCEVFATPAVARKALGTEAEAPGRVTYLKEQAWKTDFASAPVTERELSPSVSASGDIRPVAGREARLVAATAGRVQLVSPAPVLGTPVRKGQILATIAPRPGGGVDRASLEGDVQAAEAELVAAEAQQARAERLFKEQAVPEKNVEEARTRATVARARLSGTRGRLQQFTAGASGLGNAGRGSHQVRSPIAGTLVAIGVASGEGVEEGKLLFTVIDLGRVWLQASVFEPDIPKVENARTAWFSIEGYDSPFSVDESNGKLITVGRVIDPQSRTVPVIFELGNPKGQLRIGQFAKVSIATGRPVRAPAIPESALIDEAGKPVVFVQVEGESFERRHLTLGIVDRGWVQVLSGVRVGERVVTRGAYEIKLAAASGAIPAHGHAH